MEDEPALRLRPMLRADVPTLARWLREPLVAEWWHDDPETVEQRYGPSLDDVDHVTLRIAEESGQGVGLVQWFRMADEPEYRAELSSILAVSDEAWSMDYLLGEPAARGRGLGRALVAAALAEIGPVPLVVPVHAANAASIAVLRANGFIVAARGELSPDNPMHSRAHVVLVRQSAVAAART